VKSGKRLMGKLNTKKKKGKVKWGHGQAHEGSAVYPCELMKLCACIV